MSRPNTTSSGLQNIPSDARDKDKRSSATWHLWSLDTVVIELQLCPAALAAEIAELMIPGHISFLDSNTGSVARRFQEKYNATGTRMLKASLSKRSEPALQLTARSFKILLQKKQSWKDEAQFHPPLADSADVATVIQDLVSNLETPHYQKHPSTLTFRSPIMDPYIKPFMDTRRVNSMLPHKSSIMTSIMHCGALLTLETSAPTSTSEVHLLSGTRVYLVYPPTPQNMALLDVYFQDLGKGSSPDHTDVCRRMQEGITFLQYPGQIVTIPSYCPTVVFAASTNAAVTLRTRYQEDLPSRLQYLDLLVSQTVACQRVLGRPQTAAEVVEHKIVQLHEDLRASEGELMGGKLMSALNRAWKKDGVRFREMIEQHISEGLREKLLDNMPKL